MNFQQLRFVHQTVLQKFNLTHAAKQLFTSQPALSKGILELEDELGGAIFHRHGKRLTGLTAMGEAFYPAFTRILLELDNIKTMSVEQRAADQGRLVIATTHTQARYSLPRVLTLFRKRYPNVQLLIHQGNPTQLAQYVLRGEADLAIATEGLAQVDGLCALPLYQWEHMVVAPGNHPLISSIQSGKAQLSLAEMAAYPLITYDRAFAGRSKIDRAFAAHNIKPNIVLEAVDADVIKTYVKARLGIGIIPSVAFHAPTDKPLIALSAKAIFGENTTRIAFKQDGYLRQYTYDFIEMFSPQLNRKAIENYQLKIEN